MPSMLTPKKKKKKASEQGKGKENEKPTRSPFHRMSLRGRGKPPNQGCIPDTNDADADPPTTPTKPKGKRNAAEKNGSAFKKVSLRGRGKAAEHAERPSTNDAENETDANHPATPADVKRKRSTTKQTKSPFKKISLRGKGREKAKFTHYPNSPFCSNTVIDLRTALARGPEVEDQDAEQIVNPFKRMWQRAKRPGNEESTEHIPATPLDITHLDTPKMLVEKEGKDTEQRRIPQRPTMYGKRKLKAARQAQSQFTNHTNLDRMTMSESAKGKQKATDETKTLPTNDEDLPPPAMSEKATDQTQISPSNDEDLTPPVMSEMARGKQKATDQGDALRGNNANFKRPTMLTKAKVKQKAYEDRKIPLTNDEILNAIRSDPPAIAAASELYNSYREVVINTNRSSIESRFNIFASKVIPDPEKAECLIGCHIVMMVSYLFPQARRRELNTIAYCALWLFLLGNQVHLKPHGPDYFSCKDSKPGWVEGKRLDPWEMSIFVEKALGMDPKLEETSDILEGNVLAEIFQDTVGNVLKDEYTGAQLSLFIEQVEYFMEQAQEEQNAVDKDLVLTEEAYQTLRMALPAGIGGSCVLLSLVQFAAGCRVHRKITDILKIKKLWDETLIIVYLTIDLVAFCLKEDEALFLNAVIVYFKETVCTRLQTAADEVWGQLREAIANFEQYAVELMAERRKHSLSKEDVNIIVDGFRNVFVGYYRWISYAVATAFPNGIPHRVPDSDTDSD